MAQNLKQVSWFRLIIIIGLSLTTSASFFYADEQFTRGEMFNTFFQAGIAAFSFLQCPESARRKKQEDRKNDG